MSYFFYHVIDNLGKVRIGYLEANDSSAVHTLFQKASVRSIETIQETERPVFYGERILIYFEASKDSMLVRGTVESTSEKHALETLQTTAPDMTVRAVSTQNIDQVSSLEEIYANTAKLFAVQQAEQKEIQVPVIVEQTPPPQQEATQGTVLDWKYKELLLFIGNKISEIGRDPAYVSIVAELASLIFIQKEKSVSSLREKYETLHALMREIALIEDELDPTPLKSDLREAIERMVPFLQQVEKLEAQAAIHTNDTTPSSKPKENLYDIKRREVLRLHQELEELQNNKQGESETLDISLRSVFISELPKLLKWICIAGISIKIISDLAFLTLFQVATTAPGPLEKLITTLSTHTLFTKALIASTGLYLLLAIYERYWKKYYIVMLSLLAFLCVVFFLSITP